MKYRDSVERSAELLRLALPLMARHATGFHPVSFAVWYEYASQGNAALTAAVDELLKVHGRLDESHTYAVFRQHVQDAEAAASDRAAENAQRVLQEMAESAAVTDGETQRFGSALDRFGDLLAVEPAPMAVDMVEVTHGMREAIDSLQQRLSESQREISQLRTEVERVRHEALVDAMTGLANRRAFDQRMAAAIDLRPPTRERDVGLIVADIDHFKRINDKYGHSFGDQVLKAVSEVLKMLAPKEGLAARIGGEEFALLIPATSHADAAKLAERLRAVVAGSRVRRGAGEVIETVTISLGVACRQAGESPEQLLERADSALYASKQNGRNRVTALPIG